MFKRKPKESTEPVVVKKTKGVVTLDEAKSVVAAAEATAAAEAAQQEAAKIDTITSLGWIYAGARTDTDGHHVASKRLDADARIEREGEDLDKLLRLVLAWEEYQEANPPAAPEPEADELEEQAG